MPGCRCGPQWPFPSAVLAVDITVDIGEQQHALLQPFRNTCGRYLQILRQGSLSQLCCRSREGGSLQRSVRVRCCDYVVHKPERTSIRKKYKASPLSWPHIVYCGRFHAHDYGPHIPRHRLCCYCWWRGNCNRNCLPSHSTQNGESNQSMMSNSATTLPSVAWRRKSAAG